MSQQSNNVLLRDAQTGAWLHFQSPRRIIVARRLDEVLPALREIENEVSRGHHAAGFLGYEASGAFDPALATHPAGDFPLLWFGIFDAAASFELPAPDLGAYELKGFTPTIDQNSYRQVIARIKEYIRAGDTYQVNYTLRLRSPFSGDPWHLFLAMARAQPDGYPAFIDTGRWAVASASPELFFRMENGRLTCQPMKGTVRRGRTSEEDAEMARWLRESEKNRAENLMIVDMIRNDLGRVAATGSVRVPALFETERHPTLWQMTSTVTGMMAESCPSITEILSALFPCASITGAPKVRTMRIIKELEPDPRHLYTGGIGYFSPDGAAQFSVAIRTALVDRANSVAEYGAGGGIVIDSDADEEYAEALLKARVFTEQPPEFDLLETMRFTPEEGYFLLDYHLRRLRDSAAYFDFPFDEDRLRRRLEEKAGGFGSAPQRVRLLLKRDGTEEIESAPLVISQIMPRLLVKLAARPVDSSSPFLYHKTTRRAFYERARAEFPDGDDVLLWNGRGELTETTVANVVVELDGKRLTPPTDAGLLPGTLRQWLLDQGEIEERTIRLEDLPRATGLWRVNSVRGWQELHLK